MGRQFIASKASLISIIFTKFREAGLCLIKKLKNLKLPLIKSPKLIGYHKMMQIILMQTNSAKNWPKFSRQISDQNTW